MQSLPQGVIVPIITPFKQHEIFNVIDHLRQGGVRAIFLLGTTGEALQLKHQDKLTLIRSVAGYLPNDMQLLVGISSSKMEESIELMQAADQAGAIAAVISPLVVGNDVLQIVHTLLQACPASLFLYNYPAIARDRFIPISDILQLCTEPRMLGIKDSSGDLGYFKQLLACKSKHPAFKVYYGPEKQLQEAIQLPIDGFVPGTGNLVPDLAVRIWQEKENGPWQAFEAAKQQIIMTDKHYIQGIKMLMQQQGRISNSQLHS